MTGHMVRLALSDHDPSLPSTPDDLRRIAGEIEEGLIEGEVQFSDPLWRDVDGLLALANEIETRTAA